MHLLVTLSEPSVAEEETLCSGLSLKGSFRLAIIRQLNRHGRDRAWASTPDLDKLVVLLVVYRNGRFIHVLAHSACAGIVKDEKGNTTCTRGIDHSGNKSSTPTYSIEMLMTPRCKQKFSHERKKTKTTLALQKKHQKRGSMNHQNRQSQAKRDSRCQKTLPLILSRRGLTIFGSRRRYSVESGPKCLIQCSIFATTPAISCVLM